MRVVEKKNAIRLGDALRVETAMGRETLLTLASKRRASYVN